MSDWDDVLPPVADSAPASNGVGIAGFVCSLISLLFAIIPIVFFFLSIPLGIAGVVLSVMGRNRAALGAPSGDLSTAGLVLGIVSLAWTFLWFVALA